MVLFKLKVRQKHADDIGRDMTGWAWSPIGSGGAESRRCPLVDAFFAINLFVLFLHFKYGKLGAYQMLVIHVA